MLSGWIAGTALFKLLETNEFYTLTNKDLIYSMYIQNKFIVGDDFVLGEYGGECSKAMQDQKFMCECNQGGRTAFLKMINSNNKL